jgi:Tfp pilus assembly protein PilF
MKKQFLGIIPKIQNSFFVVLLLTACWSQAAAQGGGNPSNQPSGSRPGVAISHTIRGKVFLPSGATPDQRMRVVLEVTTGSVAGEIFTDSVGNFEFRGLPNSVYRVTVPSDNRSFETGTETVEVYGNFSRTVMVQIYLREKDSGSRVVMKDKLISAADMQDVPKAAKKAYDKGLKLAQQQKHEEALKLFEESLKEFPSYLLALNKLGEQHLALKHPAEAQAAFQKALEINPKFVLPHINMGILFTAQKQLDEAIREFEACNQIDDSYPMSHLNLGLALMSLQQPDFDRAEKELTRCLQLGGRNFVDVHKYLFNLHVRQNAMDKAAQQLEAYLSEVPEAPDAEDVRQQLQRVKKYIAQQASAVKK